MIEIRAATQEDRPLIYATWLRSYKHGAAFPRHIPDETFFEAHHNVVEALLDRSTVLVAHPPDDPEVILGWSVVETLLPEADEPSPIVVHYVYVKPAFRRAGVARRLLAQVGRAAADGAAVWYSHETYLLRADQLAAHVARWRFDPYAALQYAGGRSDADD